MPFAVKHPKIGPESILPFLDISSWRTLHDVLTKIKEEKLKIKNFRVPGYIAMLELHGFVDGTREGLKVRFKLTQKGFDRKRELFPGA